MSADKPARHVTENTIYVRNINYHSKAEDIAESFKKFGAIKGVRIASAQFRGKIMSLGYCFVEFKEHEGQENSLKSVKEQPIKLDGRTLKVWPARPPRAKKGDTIFVSGIPKGTTKEMIAAVFEKYGIKDIRLKKEDEDGKRGFAFVQFNTSNDQEKAVAENKTIQLNGGESKIKYARPIPKFQFRRKAAPKAAPAADGEGKKKPNRRRAPRKPKAPAAEAEKKE